MVEEGIYISDSQVIGEGGDIDRDGRTISPMINRGRIKQRTDRRDR